MRSRWLSAICLAVAACASLAVADNPIAPAPPSKRPACPAGWNEFDSPALGMKGYVPPGYWVRMRGGAMLTVEKIDGSATAAFMVPFRPKAKITARQLADHFGAFANGCEPRFKASATGEAEIDRAYSDFVSFIGGTAVEGRYCAILSADGSMGFVIGVIAPKGKLKDELPVLQQIAGSFGFTNPKLPLAEYRSQPGGFTMLLPKGWTVESTDGKNGKSDIEMTAFDPRNLTARAFNLAPRVCSPQLLQDPLHQIRGYQAGGFRDHKECALACIRQLAPNAELTMMKPDQPLTELCRGMIRDVARILQAMQLGQMDVALYDCAAEAEVQGKKVTIVFIIGIRTQLMGQGLVDLEIGVRGWCAPKEDFLNATPLLDMVQNSFAVTPAFVNKIVAGNEQAAKKIMEVGAQCREIDEQIRRNHWDTQDAIAEMYYNLWTDNNGYVNEKTGRVENIPSDKVIKNSRGEVVSSEEVLLQHIPADQATVVRDAYSEDYMRGVYGRIQF